MNISVKGVEGDKGMTVGTTDGVEAWARASDLGGVRSEPGGSASEPEPELMNAAPTEKLGRAKEVATLSA